MSAKNMRKFHIVELLRRFVKFEALQVEEKLGVGRYFLFLHEPWEIYLSQLNFPESKAKIFCKQVDSVGKWATQIISQHLPKD